MTNQELDDWSAIKAMRWRRASRHWVKDNKLQYAFDSWHPTESIADAFMVILINIDNPRLQFFGLTLNKSTIGGYIWEAKFYNGRRMYQATADKDKPSLAICLAAKKAIEGK